MISNLVPSSLRNYLQSLRHTSSGSSGSQKKSIAELGENPKTGSNIELVDRNRIGGYVNIDTANKTQYIYQTRDFDVEYAPYSENLRKPEASFQI